MATDIIARGMITEYKSGTNINFKENDDGSVTISASGNVSSEDTVARDTIDNHKLDKNNPHNVTAEQIGLNNVDNTADLDKPISTAVQTALNDKANTKHTHKKSDITDFPNSLPANGGNADTVDGYHVSELILGVDGVYYDDFTRIDPVSKTIGNYDTQNLKVGLADNANNAYKVNNHTVNSDVPTNAVFTDTIYDDTELSNRVKKNTDDISQLFDITKGGEAVNGNSSYTIENTVDYPLIGFNLYGKSVQDGTPSPDAPIDIVSVGDSGNITITCEDQNGYSLSAEITSALPLCGIPVSEGGNYVDSTGQQWICDELVYNADGTGKIIKRINKTVFNGSEAWALIGGGKYAYFKPLSDLKGKPVSGTTKPFLLSNKYTAINGDNFFSAKMCMTFDSAGSFMINDERFINNIDELKADMSADNLIVVYALATPYEIQLTSTEMSALRQLQTFDGTTSISNSAGAEMSVKYCTSKALSEFVLPITKGLQTQIDELRTAILSLGGNV